MKSPITKFILALSMVTLFYACGDETAHEETYDNQALFDAIQQQLSEKHLTLEEFIEKTESPEGLPSYYREFSSMSFDEFQSEFSEKSEQELHAELLEIQTALNEHD